MQSEEKLVYMFFFFLVKIKMALLVLSKKYEQTILLIASLLRQNLNKNKFEIFFFCSSEFPS